MKRALKFSGHSKLPYIISILWKVHFMEDLGADAAVLGKLGFIDVTVSRAQPFLFTHMACVGLFST